MTTTVDPSPLAALVAALPVRCEAVLTALLAGGEVGALLRNEDAIAHAFLAAGLVSRDPDGMRLWVMGEPERLGAATHQGGPLDWLRGLLDLGTSTPAAPFTRGEEAARLLDGLYRFKRATLGREPTVRELEHWAGTYETLAAALRELAAFARAEQAGTTVAAPAPARPLKARTKATRYKPKALGGKPGAWDTTRVRPPPGAPTPEQVLAKLPKAPPQRAAR